MAVIMTASPKLSGGRRRASAVLDLNSFLWMELPSSDSLGGLPAIDCCSTLFPRCKVHCCRSWVTPFPRSLAQSPNRKTKGPGQCLVDPQLDIMVMPFQRTSSQSKKNARAKSPARSGSHRKVVYSLTSLPDFPMDQTFLLFSALAAGADGGVLLVTDLETNDRRPERTSRLR